MSPRYIPKTNPSHAVQPSCSLPAIFRCTTLVILLSLAARRSTGCRHPHHEHRPTGAAREYVEFSQGEVNETNQRQAGNLCGPSEGQLVVRGANIGLYVTRPASQGADLFLNTTKFLADTSRDSKAFHSSTNAPLSKKAVLKITFGALLHV